MPHLTRVVVGDVTLAVRTWQGHVDLHPPAVLLPATGKTAEDWDVVAESLAGSRTVHAVNLRGHGRSDWPGRYSIRLLADDVTALLPRLVDRPVDLVAHSLGGLVACAVASARPRLVRRLVLEDVGLLRPRPPAPPSRPAGAVPFDWRMVEQVRPEIDDPDPGWRRSSPRSRRPPCPGAMVSGVSASKLRGEPDLDRVLAWLAAACVAASGTAGVGVGVLYGLDDGQGASDVALSVVAGVVVGAFLGLCESVGSIFVLVATQGRRWASTPAARAALDLRSSRRRAAA